MATNGKHADFKLCNLNKVSLSLHIHAVLKATYRPIIMINISYFLRKKGKVQLLSVAEIKLTVTDAQSLAGTRKKHIGCIQSCAHFETFSHVQRRILRLYPAEWTLSVWVFFFLNLPALCQKVLLTSRRADVRIFPVIVNSQRTTRFPRHCPKFMCENSDRNAKVFET